MILQKKKKYILDYK